MVAGPSPPAPGLLGRREFCRWLLTELIRKKAPQILVNRKPERFRFGGNLSGCFRFYLYKYRSQLLNLWTRLAPQLYSYTCLHGNSMLQAYLPTTREAAVRITMSASSNPSDRAASLICPGWPGFARTITRTRPL